MSTSYRRSYRQSSVSNNFCSYSFITNTNIRTTTEISLQFCSTPPTIGISSTLSTITIESTQHCFSRNVHCRLPHTAHLASVCKNRLLTISISMHHSRISSAGLHCPPIGIISIKATITTGSTAQRRSSGTCL